MMDKMEVIKARLKRKLDWAEQNYLMWGSLRYQEIVQAYQDCLTIIDEELQREEKVQHE